MIAVHIIGLACTFYCVEEYLTSWQEKLDLLVFLEENEPLGLEQIHKFGKVMQRTILLLSRAFKEWWVISFLSRPVIALFLINYNVFVHENDRLWFLNNLYDLRQLSEVK